MFLKIQKKAVHSRLNIHITEHSLFFLLTERSESENEYFGVTALCIVAMHVKSMAGPFGDSFASGSASSVLDSNLISSLFYKLFEVCSSCISLVVSELFP